MPGHTFLYSPPVNMIRDLIHSGELGSIYFISMSRVNLGLHQSDVSVAWDLGPHDFSILRYWLDETPVASLRDEPQLRLPGDPGRRLHQPRVPGRHDRARRAVVARAEQAAADDDRRLEQDGRLRRRQQRAGARLRLRRNAPRPAVVRRVPALVPHRRHRLSRDPSPRSLSSSRWPTSATPSAPAAFRVRLPSSASRSFA